MVVDFEKVNAARSGDKDSFAQVYETIVPDLYKVALYTLGNSHDAEDVVSDTFVDAFRSISKLREPSSFRPWIMKILSIRCKHKISDYVRQKSHMDIEDFSISLEDGTDVSGGVSEKVTLMKAMARLSEQERHVIALSITGGYTTKEIAGILGVPHGTVSSKLHRSLAKLRKMLEAQA